MATFLREYMPEETILPVIITFCGSSAGQCVRRLQYIAVGNAAGQGLSEVTGHDNVFMGFGAAYLISSGNYNIGIGNHCLGGNNVPANYMTGSYNVCVGNSAERI